MSFPEPEIHPRPTFHPCGPDAVLYAVPGNPAPEPYRLVWARGDAADPSHVRDVTLSLPRELVRTFMAFLAESGAIDREPTAEELSAIMQMAGSMLIKAQGEILGELAGCMIETLGDGDHERAEAASLETVVARLVQRAVRSGKVKPEEAADAAERIRNSLRDRMESGEGFDHE
jgi:hypothetical protein